MFRVILALLSLLLLPVRSFAALDLTAVTVDTAPVFVMAGIVITAIAGIWAIKKVIKLGNRS